MSAMPPPGTRRRPGWRQPLLAALIVFGAFALGVLLFVLLWLDERSGRDFYRAPVAPPTSDAPVFAPLPAPMPADQNPFGASGMGRPEEIERPPPRIIEEVAPPPPARPAEPARPAAVASREPVPIETPAPRYPAQAMRRGESGTVLVRIQIGPDGVPTDASIERSSRSRTLDRAALDTVKRWRFRPAQGADGPVAGSVVVPIDFRLDR